MAPIAARKARMVLANVARIVACELVAGAQAIEFRAPLIPGKGEGRARLVRACRVEDDRPLGDAIRRFALSTLDGARSRSPPHLGRALP
jgi:histidine ammonia-lyase